MYPTRASGAGDQVEIHHQVSDTTSTDETNDGSVTEITAYESQVMEPSQDRSSEDIISQPAENNQENSFRRRNSALGVLGVDYIEHKVLPTDTLKGICLAYNISAVRLRQANLLSSDCDSLVLAPKLLAIPIAEGFYWRVKDTGTQDYKLNVLTKQFAPKLGKKEAKAYLELSDWVLEDALATAREDFEWEKEAKDDFF